MKLFIGGGVEEHGRNCFLLENDEYCVMIDCGIKEGEEGKRRYPLLTSAQIKKTKYLFITHSHKDHTGALSWLYEKGFKGTVIVSDDTFHQMRSKPLHPLILSKRDIGEIIELDEGFSFKSGRSGHCAGSLWYLIALCGKRFLFSGDYCEHSPVFVCDPIRNVKADIALIDCAYGNDTVESKEHIQLFLNYCRNLMGKGKSLVLPSPLFGRSLDLLYLMDTFHNMRISVDKRILYTYLYSHDFWCSDLDPYPSSKFHLFDGTVLEEQTVYIIGDPQLEKGENREFVHSLIDRGGLCIFTGHLDKNSYAKELYEDDKALFYRYYVHQNYKDVENIIEHNDLDKIILNHCDHVIDIQEGRPVLSLSDGTAIEVEN